MRSLKPVGVGLLTFAISIASLTARAEFQILDPDNVLTELKQRASIAVVPMEKTLACGTKKTFTATDARCEYRCTTSFCSSRCETAMGFEEKFDLHIDECKPDGAGIFGDNGLSLNVGKTEYELDGSWIRALLRGAGHFIQPEGTFKLIRLWRANVSRIDGGKLVPVRNAHEVQIELAFGAAGTQTEALFILVDLDKTGLDQLLAFGTGSVLTAGGGGNAMFLLQRGVVIPKSGGFFP